MTRKRLLKNCLGIGCLAGVLMTFSSFLIPSSMRFYPMLMAKTDVAALMANTKFSYLTLVNTNLGLEDNSRLSYQLAAYAYNTSNVVISPYGPLKLTKSVTDSAFSKDVYISSYKVLKTSLSTVVPTTTYSYLRFTPYGDRADAKLANYISYAVYPVAADGITKVGTKVLNINPSPPY